MFKKETRSNIMYALLALLFSLVLFFNSNRASFQNTLTSTSSFEEVLEEVPVTIRYDSDQYFIQGYEPTVRVDLTSVNRIQLNAEKNEETRSFRVVADLTNLTEGTHDVPLVIENISNSVRATIDSEIFTVTIEKKVSQSYPVQFSFSEQYLQDGYELDTIVAEPQEVTITTGDQTIQDIAGVYADLSTLSGVSGNQDIEVPVYAVTSDGETLGAIIDPETVTVHLTVSAPEKTVSLYANQFGVVSDGISHFEYIMSQTQVKVTGGLSLLDDIHSIGVPMDITNITERTVSTVQIPVPDGVSVEPNEVTIEVNPVFIPVPSSESEPESTTVTPSSSVEEEVTPSSESEETVDIQEIQEEETQESVENETE
jgi:YbbR domain-containing protein